MTSDMLSEIISEKELNALIKRYSRFYAWSRKFDFKEVRSEVGTAIVKALIEWKKLEEKTCQFKTFVDRIIKNHMSNFFKKEYAYQTTMSFSNMDKYIDNGHDAFSMPAFEILNGFTEDVPVAKEFIMPSRKVLNVIDAAEAKYAKGFRNGKTKEMSVLRSGGADCLAISLVHEVDIRKVIRIKKSLRISLKASLTKTKKVIDILSIT